MPRYENDGVEVWFGTPDAPAPAGLQEPNAPEITVGVSGAVDAALRVRYRSPGGPWQVLVLRRQEEEGDGRIAYFRGRFPDLPAGTDVEYEVHLRSGGPRPRAEQPVGGTMSFRTGRGTPAPPAIDSGPEPAAGSSDGEAARPLVAAEPAGGDGEPAHGPRWAEDPLLQPVPVPAPMTDDDAGREIPDDRLGGYIEDPGVTPVPLGADRLLVHGRVNSTAGEPVPGWRVVATFQVPASRLLGRGESPPWNPRYGVADRVTEYTDRRGDFVMELPGDIVSKAILFTVYSPDGAEAGRTKVHRQPDDGELIRVQLTVSEFTAIPLEPPDTGELLPRRLNGRVFDLRGGCAAANLQVVLWARATEAEALRPVVVTRTNASGYFAAPYPEGTFHQAQASVATVAQPLPIRLEKGSFPNPLLLGAELGSEAGPKGCADGDCACHAGVPRTPDQWELTDDSGSFSADLGAGGCPRLNVPNRAVEEYDFYSVVRTTQPEIQGLTLVGASAPPDRPTEVAGRGQLNATNPVDWDSDPTFYQATSIAHGHLLHFKQVWYADGYSLGDLVYSLPLAPGQKRLIAVVDWDRRERAAREEGTFFTESLVASLERNRDLGEVITGALSENVRGGSRNTTAGVGVGHGAAANGSYQGINFGALLGISGGYGESNSDAWQNSSRSLAASSLQRLRDSTLQSASAVRGLRSTVVQTVGEGESATFSTEVVANHNRCHALTIQYFEVLRHLKVTNELADVQECLFVPLPMSSFSRTKAIRWRESLTPYLRRPELGSAFDAARRVETSWAGSGTPVGRYADETVQSVRGELLLTFQVPLPPLPEPPGPDGWGAADEAAKALAPTSGFLGVLLAVATGGASLVVGTATQAVVQGARNVAESLAREPSPQQRYARFHREVMPRVVEGFVDKLELYAVTATGEKRLSGADFTLVSNYSPGVPLRVGVRADVNAVRRSDVSHLVIRSATGLPDGCRAIVNTAVFRYRTAAFEHRLLDDRRVNDDIDLPTLSYPRTIPEIVQAFLTGNFAVSVVAAGSGAALETPIDVWEQRNPRDEDSRQSAELVDHLNDNLEYYHHAIWWTMDPSRRFMLLDGFMIPDGERSVASVVENRLIGIMGNSLVMPVARGVNLDPRFRPKNKNAGIDFLAYYEPATPIPPSRVSLPTRGVFAEAIMGDCNSCERKDDSRLWRWEEAPLDEVPAIQPLSTESRRTEPPSTAPTPFPTPVVSIQNAPAVPDPAGVRAAIDLLGQQAFADITGLAGTQANAAAAYRQALESAGTFGKEASKLAQQAAALRSIDKSMDAIDSAEASGKISAEDARSLRLSALRRMVGEGNREISAKDVEEQVNTVDRAASKGSIEPEDARELNRTALEGYVQGDDAYGFDQEPFIQLAGGGGGTWQTAVASIGWDLLKQELMVVLKQADLTVEAPKPGGAGLLRRYPDPSDYIRLFSEPWNESMRFVFKDIGGGELTDGVSGEISIEWEEVVLSDPAVHKEEKWLGDVLTRIPCLRDIIFTVEPDTWKVGKATGEGTIKFDLIQLTDDIETRLRQAYGIKQRTGTAPPILIGRPELIVRVSIDITPSGLFGGHPVRGQWDIPLRRTIGPHEFVRGAAGTTSLNLGRQPWSRGRVVRL